jgi:PIN domain nuclease of toxin-antitoxin system
VRILLDTHALIWAFENNPRLPDGARDRLTDPDNDILFSIVSIWEILIKLRKKRLVLDWKRLIATAQSSGFRRIGVEPVHMEFLQRLPMAHGDPYDHLLIAQARAEDAFFMTLDRAAPHYPVETIWA